MSSTAVSRSTSTTQLFIFGGPKDDGSPGDYVCKVSEHDRRRPIGNSESSRSDGWKSHFSPFSACALDC